MAEQNGFECPPLVAGDWTRLTDEELDIARQLVEAHRTHGWDPAFLDPALRARALPLCFYGDGWNLVDVEGRTLDGHGACAFILGDEDFVAVTGSSSPIQDLNARLSLRLDAASVHLSAYLKFFTGVIWSDEGPFCIVETPDEAAEWLRVTEPLAVEPMRTAPGDDGPTWSAGVVHGAHLFRGTFKVHSNGQVQMLDDERQVTGSRRVFTRPPLRVVPYHLPGEASE